MPAKRASRPVAGRTALSLFLALFGVAKPSSAQEAARWNDFGPCGDGAAELALHEVVRLGDAEGDGMIERDGVGVLYGEELGYFVLDGDARFKIFNDDGRFVRAVGRDGEGPGEFAVVTSVAVVGGQIVALDAGRRSWQVFDLDGEFVAQRNFGFPSAHFVPVGGGRVVAAGMDRRPDFVGYPLHLVDLAEGAPTLHFGDDEPAKWKTTDPWAEFTVVGPGSRAGTVWGGKAGIPTAREWSGDGEPLRSIEGELEWFPRLDRHPDPRRLEPPGPLVVELMADGGDRLWMQTLLADAGWREAMGTGRGAEPVRPDPGKVSDTRIDGFDLGRQCHLGRRMWDVPGHRLFDRGGEAMIQVVSYDHPAVPQVVVYRIGWP